MNHERAKSLLDHLGCQPPYTAKYVRYIANEEALGITDLNALLIYAGHLEQVEKAPTPAAGITPAAQVAQALRSAEAEKEVCETLMRHAISRYMQATGFRVSCADIYTTEVSTTSDETRQYVVDFVKITIEKDLRFQP